MEVPVVVAATQKKEKEKSNETGTVAQLSPIKHGNGLVHIALVRTMIHAANIT